MPRGASGFSGSVNSSPTYSRRFDDPLFDLTREAILRAFRSMVTLRLFAHVEFTSRNMFDVCHWFPKRSDDSRTRASVTALMEALAAIESQIARLDEQLRELARRSPLCWRLMSVPGVMTFLRPFPVLEISTGAVSQTQGQYAFALSGVDPQQVYEASGKLMMKLRGHP